MIQVDMVHFFERLDRLSFANDWNQSAIERDIIVQMNVWHQDGKIGVFGIEWETPHRAWIKFVPYDDPSSVPKTIKWNFSALMILGQTVDPNKAYDRAMRGI